MTADGHGVVAIMRDVGVSKTTVWRWQDYFVEAGVDGLIKGRSKPPGRKPLSAAMKLKVVEKTVKERPVNATHWSVRSMAEEMGISHTSVQRIWAEHGLKPHLVRSFKISNDPDFVAKVEDIVGLVGATQTLHAAFHADILFLAQPRRAALRRNHSPAHPARNLQRRHRTQDRDCRVDRASKPKPKTLHVDRKRQIHPRKAPPSQNSARHRKSGMRMNESEH